MTKTIEIPAGTMVKVAYQTPTENIILNGEFAGFIPVGQMMFIALQNVGLSEVTQFMIPLHLVAAIEFKVKLANLSIV